MKHNKITALTLIKAFQNEGKDIAVFCHNPQIVARNVSEFLSRFNMITHSRKDCSHPKVSLLLTNDKVIHFLPHFSDDMSLRGYRFNRILVEGGIDDFSDEFLNHLDSLRTMGFRDFEMCNSISDYCGVNINSWIDKGEIIYTEEEND